jgi:hypothetical protein
VRWPRLAAILAIVFSGPAARAALAHSFPFTDVTLALRADGTFAVDVVADLDALALGVDASADSAVLAAQIRSMSDADRDRLVAGLAGLLQRRLRVRFDGEPAPFSVSLPQRGAAPVPGTPPSALGLVARLEGRVPAGAKTVSFFASRAFPPVRLAVVSPDGRRGPADVLERGGEGRPLALADLTATEPAVATAGRFLRLGFAHILPAGLDHVLFVLGLALLSPRLGPLLAQVTAFTLAHTVTLALAVYGVVSLPSRVVEPLIAASIVYVAVENLFRQRASWTRLALVFAFGLLHGLGFAGALSDLGWPQGRRLLALLSFNAGVELGQLAVIVLALLFLAAVTRAGAPRRPLERGLSVAIAAVGLVWVAQRLTA